MKRLLCVVFALALAGAASAGEWHVETVDAEDGVPEQTSLALDSSGRPHISYCNSINWDLKYASWTGSSWKLETVDSEGDMGWSTSLALDSSGYPHISYNGHGDLKYARWDGAVWQIETVDSVGGSSISLALDSSDYPHISYNCNGDLKYARWNGSSWQIQTVDSEGNVGLFTSLALDDSDYPHISYFDWTNNALKYARWDDSSWHIETVDSAEEVGWHTSLALDSSGYPHISYNGNGELKYARWDGAVWQIETVDSVGGRSASLALDSDDCPHISYLSFHYGHLRYARWWDSDWLIQIVDAEWDVGEYSSLALDSDDLPHISYYDGAHGDLKYAWYESGPGVAGAEVFANTYEEGVLVGWTITGDVPVGVRILRSAGEGEPVAVSGALPGTAARWLDTTAYDASGKGLKPLVYWLETTDADGLVSRFGPTEAVAFPGAAREISLFVYPSPASGAFTVDYTLPTDGPITIALYDLSGRRVSTVFDGETAAGRHEFSCDASALTPGVYLVRLAADAGSLTRRVVIAR